MSGLFEMAMRGGVFFALLVATGCSYAHVDSDFAIRAKGMDPASFTCCADPEKFYPDPFVRLALGVGNVVGPTFADAAYGRYEETEFPGSLTGKPEAQAAILHYLQPLDILLVSDHSYQIGRLMPGRFSHSVVYLGTEAELRRAGLWNLPALVPWHDEIRAGKTMIEAAYPDVHLVTPEKTFEVDQVLAVRPALTAADKRAAVARMFSVIGNPYNFELGIDPAGKRFACTGLVAYAMPEAGFHITDLYGQRAVLPDDVAAQAIRGERLQFLAYVVGTEDGFALHSRYALMVQIASYWGVPDQGS